MIKWVEEKGWNILNRNIEGEEEGNYTYMRARGNTVIDYVIVNYEMLNKIEKMEGKGKNRIGSSTFSGVNDGRKRWWEDREEGGREEEAGLDRKNNKQIPRENRRENNYRGNSKREVRQISY